MHLFHCTWWTLWELFHHKIRKLIKDDEFVNSMNDLELLTWTSLVDAGKNLLGNRRAENYKELVEKLLKSLQDIGTHMSINVHFYIAIKINFRIIAAMWMMKKRNNSICISKQWMSATGDASINEWWLTTVKVSKKNFKNIEHDIQQRENFYHGSYVHKGFISAVSLLNDLMKILIGLVLKTLRLIVNAKIVFLNKQINICWFRYELRGLYYFTLRNIDRNINLKKNAFFPKLWHFCTAKTVANQEQVR